MSNVLIGIVGKDRDCEHILCKGFKKFFPDKIILLTKPKYIKKSKKIERNLSNFDFDLEIVEISSFPHLEEVFMTIKDLQSLNNNDTLVINVDVDYMTSCLALSSSFVNGIQAIGVLGEEVIAYPVMKFSYYNAINEKKMCLLKILNNYEKISSMEKLAKLSKMSLPLIAYHLRGNRDSQGLVEMNLVQTEKNVDSSVGVSLTELGRLIAKGYVEVKK